MIAVLGLSPNVVTEFLWWLSYVAGIAVDSVEVWTTTRGRRGALELLRDQDVWNGLDRTLSLAKRPALPPFERLSFRLFGSEADPVDDIRSEDDARLLLQQLCDRVRDIHEEEAGCVRLHALMSGGRKTMGAALQTAVQLFGEDGDVVYHALLHPDIEANREASMRFAFPVGPLEVSGPDGRKHVLRQKEQVVVARQPVPLLRPLLPAGAFRIVVEDLIRRVSLRALQAATESLKWDVVTSSPAMEAIRREIALFAPRDLPILIEGETGTGKELIARAIHANSGRRGPFHALNCGAIPKGLVESALFGHERGAFTGAVGSALGAFAAAEDGTLLLDEVGTLPLHAQVALLRVLQEKVFRPVGSTEERRTNARVVAATNVRLQEAVQEGTFREDLYYRLRVVALALPPLRQRREDIPLLVEHFLRKGGDAKQRAVTEPAMDALKRHSWPGNVRQLESVIEVAAIRAGTGPVDVGHLPEEITEPANVPPFGEPSRPRPASADELARDSAHAKEVLLRERLEAASRAGGRVNRTEVVRSLQPGWKGLKTDAAKKRLAGWLGEDPVVRAHFGALAAADPVRELFEWAMSTRRAATGLGAKRNEAGSRRAPAESQARRA